MLHEKEEGVLMDWGTFRIDKAREVLLYILSKGCKNMYNVLKVVYFADKEHMKMAGSTICKDRYIAMVHGPVPSGMYDLLKSSKLTIGDPYGISDIIERNGPYNFAPRRGPDMDFLSDLDKECLDYAINKYGMMPFAELKRISHEQPDYMNANENDEESFEDFVKSVDDGGQLRAYFDDIMENVVC
jgi:uncharacterized phage-associated protein